MDYNLCCYDHPIYVCAGKDRETRKSCKHHPKNRNDGDNIGTADCPHFRDNESGHCRFSIAQFEAWALMLKPEAVR